MTREFFLRGGGRNNHGIFCQTGLSRKEVQVYDVLADPILKSGGAFTPVLTGGGTDGKSRIVPSAAEIFRARHPIQIVPLRSMRTSSSRLLLSAAAILAGLTPACHREEAAFTELDLNHNHKLSLSELQAAVVTGLFNTYDADKDGVITKEEWRKKDPGGDGNFMRQRDLNRDGRITREEALVFTKRQGFCLDVLGQADRNGNGTIERKEAAVWISDHPEVLERMKLGN